MTDYAVKCVIAGVSIFSFTAVAFYAMHWIDKKRRAERRNEDSGKP